MDLNKRISKLENYHNSRTTYYGVQVMPTGYKVFFCGQDRPSQLMTPDDYHAFRVQPENILLIHTAMDLDDL